MSRLVCSLLALAVLLAAATAAVGDPDPYCGELIQGYKTDMVRYFERKGHGGPYNIPDDCGKNIGVELVGQSVVVCNRPYSKPVITEDLEYTPFSRVNVDCPSDTYGCEDLTVEVTQYCDVVGPQRPRARAG